MFLVDRAAVGSWATPKTIGIVAVAVLAASAASVLLGVAITATRRCTKGKACKGRINLADRRGVNDLDL
jgi:hypothetical protein